MREKALTALERDRLREQVAALKAAAASAGTGGGGSSTTGGLEKGSANTGAEEEAERDTIKGMHHKIVCCECGVIVCNSVNVAGQLELCLRSRLWLFVIMYARLQKVLPTASESSAHHYAHTPAAHTPNQADARAHGAAVAPARGGWLPAAPRRNPFWGLDFEEMALQQRRPEQTVTGHTLGVAHVAVHPRKPVVVRILGKFALLACLLAYLLARLLARSLARLGALQPASTRFLYSECALALFEL